jgi:hypothetical protein
MSAPTILNDTFGAGSPAPKGLEAVVDTERLSSAYSVEKLLLRRGTENFAALQPAST